MNHTLFAGSIFDEAADVLVGLVLACEDLDHRCGIDRADLRLKAYSVDSSLGHSGALAVDSGDDNGTVIIDVDLGAAVCHDFLDNRSALAYDLAYLIGVNVHGGHFGGIFGNLGAWRGNSLEQYLIDDIVTSAVGGDKRLLDYFGCQTVYLEVHLNGGDTLVSTCNLKVHVAVEVFKSLNVEHGVPRAVLSCDKAAGDTGNRRFDRHTGVHERQR